MQTTKKVHINPNGNIIKINGNIYRHYTRNLSVSLPSIFYAISHGATVYEVLSNGDTIELNFQNYALDNEKIIMKKKNEEKNEEIILNDEKEDIVISNKTEEPTSEEKIENTEEPINYDDDKDYFEDLKEEKDHQKKLNKRNNSKKNYTE